MSPFPSRFRLDTPTYLPFVGGYDPSREASFDGTARWALQPARWGAQSHTRAVLSVSLARRITPGMRENPPSAVQFFAERGGRRGRNPTAAPRARWRSEQTTNGGQTMIQSEVQKITPQMAEIYLKKNDKNRKIAPSRVEKYAAMMSRGEWLLNGEPIILNGNGQVLDGQHRLMAVALSGIPIEMLVVSGVGSEAFGTIDQGAGRTFGDIMHIRGVNHAKTVAAATRTMLSIESGVPYTQWNYDGKRAPTMRELEGVLAQHPGLCESVDFLIGLEATRGVIQPGVGACLHYTLAKLDGPMANMFFTQLLTGAEIEAGSHMHILRERLLSRDPQHKHLTSSMRAALAIKTWNRIRAGLPVLTQTRGSSLSFKSKGKHREEFPVPV